MSSATSDLAQPSGCFVQPGTARTLNNRTLKVGSRHNFRNAPTAVRDLSVIYPQAVVASSEELGWQNLRALEMRQTISEWTMPPLENHCIMVQLGSSMDSLLGNKTGAVTARIGDQNFEQRLEPGAITIVPAGLSVDWQQEDTPSQTLHLYLDPQFLRKTAQSIDINYSQVSITPQFAIRDEHIHHIGMSLRHELKDSNVSGRLYADALAKVLAMQLVRLYSYFKELRTSRGGMAPRKLRKAIDFINSNLDEEQAVALHAVADELQMSYPHFSRAFKQSMGVSPKVYLTEQRIERAKKLLSATDLPIVDIALRTGFASQSYFTSTFRKLVWTTPKTFRDTR